MRKLITLLFVTALGLEASAQLQPIVWLRDTNDVVVNGSTVIVYGDGNTELEADLVAELTAPMSKNINVRRHELNVVANTKNYFCWGVCYLPRNSGQTPTWVSVDPIVMVPAQEYTNFHAYYRPLGEQAYCCFQYVWYDMANPNDSTWVNICFDTQTFTGVDEVAAAPSLTAYPNPVSGEEVTFTYDAAGGVGGLQLVLYNALGARTVVRSVSTNNGRATLPTAGLAPGVWFAALEQNGRMVATRRVVVGR
jgi:hypothetical protein